MRLRQLRLAEARTLLARAIALDPEHKSRWQSALTAARNPGGGPHPAVAMDRAQSAGGNSRQVGQALALQLREQASAASDPATRIGLYRAAVAAGPENPWARLDLGRALFRLGQAGEARAVTAALVGRHPTPDALKAGIIFANETSDPDVAAALIARLPPSLRTPDMRSLLMPQPRAGLLRQPVPARRRRFAWRSADRRRRAGT